MYAQCNLNNNGIYLHDLFLLFLNYYRYSLRYVNILRTSSSWSPASEVIGYYCTSERAVLSAPRRLRRYAVSSAEDIAVDESLDKNSQEGKSRESSGQLLGCSRIFIVYFIV